MEDRAWVTKMTKGALTPKRLHERCLVVLLAASGKTNEQIAKKLRVTRQKVGRWRARFVKLGRAGIESDRPGRGRKPVYPPEIRRHLVKKTTTEIPVAATHWSRTSMAKAMDLSASTVGRIWREHGLKPHLSRTFKVSNDPRFAEKLEDVIGLYLNAPEHAIVLCCDEKSQVQALDRTQPGLPLKKGRAGTMTHDYVRHGTTTLFAALNVADGQIIGQCQNRHRHQEWLKFLKLIDQQTPADREVHLILDNYATHKHAKVKAWLAKHPRFHLHFTPTSASWVNMVERFFRDLTEKRLRRGVFHSLPELVAALEEYLTHYNENPTPFVWTAQANDILKKVERARKKLRKVETLH
jgi:transposase